MAVLLLLTLPAHAKVKAGSTRLNLAVSQQNVSTSKALEEFEARLRPYLQSRARSHPAPLQSSHRLTQADNFAIARNWDRLSPGFIALYQQAVALPSAFNTYTSPGGHFDILYADTGSSAVDTLDRYSYTSVNWRIRSNSANGIPDYIDEVAWAFDSAWSMEIDRFGFAQPFPVLSAAFPSERYKVVVDLLDPFYYGITDVGRPISSTAPGFSSSITIRNEWGPEWDDKTLTYHTHPEQAIRITAVHEFHHAIQYAMTWKVSGAVYLDDFSIGWTEGTAVLMEELGFDSINDYIQYTPSYFISPQQSLFSNDFNGSVEYKNSLLALFLYYNSSATPSIDFFSKVYQLNLQAATPFSTLLNNSSRLTGSQWSQLLGAFHTQSYFTGSRAQPGRFLPDAAQMAKWSYAHDVYKRDSIFTKVVQPFAMQTFSFKRDSIQSDTFPIQFIGQHGTSNPITDNDWAVSILLRRNGATDFDTIVPLPLSRVNLDTVTLTTWRSFSELLVIVTNAHQITKGIAQITFTHKVGPPISSQIQAYPNPLSISKSQPFFLRGALFNRASVYRADGTLVSESGISRGQLSNGWHREGEFGYRWDLTNTGGQILLPGVYILMVESKADGPSALNRHQIKLILKP